MRLRAHPGVIGLTRTQRFVWWRLTMNEHAYAFQISAPGIRDVAVVKSNHEGLPARFQRAGLREAAGAVWTDTAACRKRISGMLTVKGRCGATQGMQRISGTLTGTLT